MNINTAIVTGASEGIGASLTKVLVENGWEVIGISRNSKKLNLLKNNLLVNNHLLKTFSCNVTDLDKLKLIASKNKTPKLLFLNAGIYNPVDASKNNIETYKKHLDINYLGVLNSYEAFLPKMLDQQNGHIIIMSSISGWIGLPKAAAYGPTKAALRSFAQSARYDLYKKGIKVQLCSPGFVETPATSLNDFYMPGLMKADEAAKIIYKYMYIDKFEFSFPLTFSFFMKFLSLLPDRISSFLIKKIIC